MRLPRVRFTVRRMIASVVIVALLLAALRIVVSALPHVRQCWKLAAGEERLSQAYRRAASRYRTCVQTVPCSASEYCDNACLGHANALGAGILPAQTKTGAQPPRIAAPPRTMSVPRSCTPRGPGSIARPRSDFRSHCRPGRPTSKPLPMCSSVSMRHILTKFPETTPRQHSRIARSADPPGLITKSEPISIVKPEPPLAAWQGSGCPGVSIAIAIENLPIVVRGDV